MPFEKGTLIVTHPGDPKYEASRQKGFRFRWLVAGDYELRDRMLAPVRHSQWRDYYPANQKNLPIQLAKIKEGDEKALLAFARKYGSLGFTGVLPFVVASIHTKRLLPSDRKSIEKLKRECCLPDIELWKSWIASGGDGDPLPWIWAHVRTIRLCIELGLYIKDEDEEGLTSFLRKSQWRDSRRSPELVTAVDVAFQHSVTLCTWSQPKDWTVLEFGKYLRRELINKNIQGIRIALEPEGNRERSYFEYRSLIEVAYWHLHNLAIDGMLKRCKREGCGGFFVQEHRGTDYCPEPKTPQKESRCAVLDRSKRNMKKYREKKRRERKPKR